MHVEVGSLLELLGGKNATFFIPPYQRNYEWEKENCDVLLKDVRRVAQANAGGTDTGHFFGSIVYVIESAGVLQPHRYVLIDGQQRITTTLLLLMALRDTVTDEDIQDLIQSQYLQNDRASDDTEYKIKLKQVETDWGAFKRLTLREEPEPDDKDSAVYRNYHHFKTSLNRMTEEEKHQLLELGLTKLNVIFVQLEPGSNSWENPQEIFESMNSLGKPLSLADLVRNYVLMGESSEDQKTLYERYWLPLEKRLPGQLSTYIRDWLQAQQHRSYKVAQERNYKQLYSEFKANVRDVDTHEVFESLRDFSRPYAMVIGQESTGVREIDQIIDDFDLIDARLYKSYLAEVLQAWLNKKLNNQKVIEIFSAIRTYILRRRIIARSGSENKRIPQLGGDLHRLIDAEDAGTEMFRQLASFEYAGRLPNDLEVAAALKSLNFYNLGKGRNLPRLLLSMAEEALTKSRPDPTDKNLQLEHIMPRTPSPSWRQELGANASEIHQDLVNSLGNITLIRHNQELGNKSFAEKKRVYRGNSGLQITQNHVLERERWDAEFITQRTEYLIDLFLNQVLVLPDQFRAASNWNTDQQRSFDQKEVLNKLIGETINYVDDPQISAVVLS